MACCSPLLFGFTLAFVILFDDDDSLNAKFPGPLVKVLVMMTGEFEYNDTFKSDQEGGTMSETAKGDRAIRLLLFSSFLILIPVSFFNLLTGFALERVMVRLLYYIIETNLCKNFNCSHHQELRERAKVGRLAKTLEQIYFIESILLSLSPLKKLLPHGKIARCLRKYNVTTAMFVMHIYLQT